jgi:hypothetical protein
MRKQIVKVTLQVLLLVGIATAMVSSVTSLQAGKACQLTAGVCVHPICESCNDSCTACVP